MATNTLRSPHILRLLDRLFVEDDSSHAAMQQVTAQLDLPRLMTSKTQYRALYGLLKQMPLPVSRETGYLLYMLARSTHARTILEFGTSFGVSTIYLAAALRDNGGGRIITTEFEPEKAERARANLIEAGLIDLVEIREGDALQTLADGLPESIDLVLLDGAKGLYGDILKLAEARLHPGSLVLADDAHHCPEYVHSMRSDTLKYLSIALAGNLEISMKLE